jgi:catechol 2,3-dioxygenase-like lactoylglutathione lyase family enzyme
MKVVGTHHVALTTTNFARLRAFYSETLGMPVVGGFAGRNTIFIDIGTTTIELAERDSSAGDGPTPGLGWNHLALEVENVDESYTELRALGISFHVTPRSFPENEPQVRIAFFKDPDGNVLELYQPIGSRYPVG